MDLLFKRYASPFLFMEGMLKTCRFTEFVFEVIKMHNEETEEHMQWEFYLHKVQQGSFSEFIEEIKTNKEHQEMTEETKEESVRKAFSILNNFSPEERGEEQNGII